MIKIFAIGVAFFALETSGSAAVDTLCGAIAEVQKDSPEALPSEIRIGDLEAMCDVGQDSEGWLCLVFTYHACESNPNKVPNAGDDMRMAYESALSATRDCMNDVPSRPLRYELTSPEIARISEGVVFPMPNKNVYVMKKGLVAQDAENLCQAITVSIDVVHENNFDPYLPVPVDPMKTFSERLDNTRFEQ